MSTSWTRVMNSLMYLMDMTNTAIDSFSVPSAPLKFITALPTTDFQGPGADLIVSPHYNANRTPVANPYHVQILIKALLSLDHHSRYEVPLRSRRFPHQSSHALQATAFCVINSPSLGYRGCRCLCLFDAVHV